ncbi:MAG: sarcosine oxidase subunit alpha family protein [Gammaproteobacteria bacterium]|nr:sarcosine oxidase subunit alpha family protein [Gammaproteobacteria bacterium]
MTQPFRLSTGGAIQRDHPVSFQFDGRRYTGYRGDTLASALLANGIHLVGRSFKYHCARGVLTCGSEEPNALVELRRNARREPNTRATTIELYHGLDASSQNRWPSLRFDLLSLNVLAAPLLVAGFYYKTFMWPASFWEPVYERLIRRAAGLGRAAREADADSYESCHRHCDVLVVGAGPAGIAAALNAARQGVRVLLCDENASLGGRLLYERDLVDGKPAVDWLAHKVQAFSRFPNLCVLRRTTVFGAYDHNVYGAVERVADHVSQPLPGQPRQRRWTIRAQRTVIATGAHERPLVFPGNDLPGVMLASAVRAYANRFAVAVGRRVVVVTNNDDAYQTAIDLTVAGIATPLIVDTRQRSGMIADVARAAGIDVRTSTLPKRAVGGRRVRALELMTSAGQPAGRVACDCLAMSGGFNPVVHLASQQGAKPTWSEPAVGYVPSADLPQVHVVGAARGVYALADCLLDGEGAGSGYVSAARPLAGYGDAQPPQPLWSVAANGKAFVDFQNDVTLADLELAAREGYVSPEHAKRYTTLGMATDQGKTSNINALGILAQVQGKAISAMGPVTYRPPYTPVAIGSFAGHRRGHDFLPIRRTAMQQWHERAGAVFIQVGHWLRAGYYPRPGETPQQTIDRETTAVRTTAGLCDVSTLGKIELFGPDAVEFLNRLYVNGWSTLAVNKARYGLMLREDGFVFDDGTVTRLGDEHFFITTTTANAGAVLAHMEYCHQCVWPDLDVAFCSVTEQWAAMSLAGPRARRVLARVVSTDVSNEALPFMGVVKTMIDNVPVRVFRISFSGELAYEINTPWGFGQAVWERLMATGADLGLVPYGLEALNVLRIEKGHVTGAEIDGRTTAADLGFARMMNDRKDFIGRMLAKRPGLVDPIRPALVGIKAVDATVRLRSGAQITLPTTASAALSTQPSLGHVTSVAFSPTLKRWIGLALVADSRARIGEHLYASSPLHHEATPVEIVEPCFIDQDGRRLHA